MANMTVQSIVNAAKQRIDDFFQQQTDSTALAAATATPYVIQSYSHMIRRPGQLRLRMNLTPDQIQKCNDLINKHKAVDALGPEVMLPGVLLVLGGLTGNAIFSKLYKDADDETISSIGMAGSTLVLAMGAAHMLYHVTAESRLLKTFEAACLERDPNAKGIVNIENATEPVREPSKPKRNPNRWLPWLLLEGNPQVSAQYRNHWRRVDPGHIESSPLGNALLVLPLGVLGLAHKGLTAGAEAVEAPIKYAVEKMVYGAMELAF